MKDSVSLKVYEVVILLSVYRCGVCVCLCVCVSGVKNRHQMIGSVHSVLTFFFSAVISALVETI